MKIHVLALLVLAAIWGGSFLFMRLAVPEFGPFALVSVRVTVAALCLLPWMARRELALLRSMWRPLLVMGFFNAALPFCLFSFSTLHLTAGFAAILNATAPFFAAIVAWMWLGERLSSTRVLGLFVGFVGVTVLVWGRVSFRSGMGGIAVLAGLVASLGYGIAVNYTKKNLGHISPLTITTGSQIGASLLLLPMAVWMWPSQMPGVRAWASAIVLGVVCTGIAFMLYFRLIRDIGPSRAIAVTFLSPVCGVMWGALFLGEVISIQMLVGAAIIFTGTALTLGVLKIKGFDRARNLIAS